MSNEQQQPDDETIKKRLHEIFPDEVTAARVVNAVTRKTPEHYSRKSNLPYYNEYMARLTMKEIDVQIKDKCPLVWYFNSYPNYTPQTLYVRINQSINFILDNLDPDGKYRQWKSVTKVTRPPGVGVMIEYLPGFDANTEQVFSAVKTLSTEATQVWRRNMENWIEGEDNKPFVKEGLVLTNEEVRELKQGLSLVVGIACSINNTSVKIIRVN